MLADHAGKKIPADKAKLKWYWVPLHRLQGALRSGNAE
jgi:hypothetical protein